MTTIELIRRGAASDFATIITPEQCAEIVSVLDQGVEFAEACLAVTSETGKPYRPLLTDADISAASAVVRNIATRMPNA